MGDSLYRAERKSNMKLLLAILLLLFTGVVIIAWHQSRTENAELREAEQRLNRRLVLPR